MLSRDFFARSVHDVAPELVGCTLLVDGVGGRIVEVEAYDADDPASHGHRGLTARNRAMFGPPGHAYVYRSYGIHWCLNLVCAEDGRPEAVLVRALEPLAGSTACASAGASTPSACSARARSSLRALGVTGEHDGLALDRRPFELRAAEEAADVTRSARRHHAGGGAALALRARRFALPQPRGLGAVAPFDSQ